MEQNIYTDLSEGITCIDTGYLRPQMAACYLVVHNGEAAIIETGTNYTIPRITALMEQKGISKEQIRYVIPTHVHLDHAGGVGGLMAIMPNAQLVVHPRGARHLIDPAKLIQGTIAVYGEEKYHRLYGDLVPVPAERVIEAEDELKLDLNGRELLIRHTPGHAEHHFCVWDQQSKGWFSGDNFGLSYREFIGNEKRHIFPATTPVHFNPDKMLDSLNLLMSYQPKRFYLTHFCLLEEPQKYVPILKQRIQEYCDIALANEKTEDPYVGIKQALLDLEGNVLADYIADMSVQSAKEFIDMDAELNAQGLKVWLQRRAA
ncbi:MAG: MBL fold metallo-hydrolase [Gammaproteobacteria bacterium]|nr:MBL fold metallo-hydrolase [Gammaproteobacteria bacterium]